MCWNDLSSYFFIISSKPWVEFWSVFWCWSSLNHHHALWLCIRQTGDPADKHQSTMETYCPELCWEILPSSSLCPLSASASLLPPTPPQSILCITTIGLTMSHRMNFNRAIIMAEIFHLAVVKNGAWSRRTSSVNHKERRSWCVNESFNLLMWLKDDSYVHLESKITFFIILRFDTSSHLSCHINTPEFREYFFKVANLWELLTTTKWEQSWR